MTDTQRGFLGAGFGILAVVLLGGALFTSFPPEPAAPPRARVEQAPAAPTFSLERLQGGRLTLADLRGRVVVVDFWATWCPPCRAEMPWLVDMGKRLESRGVTFVAISEDDPPGQVPLVTAFAREVPGLERFALLGDPEVETRWGVTSLPTLFIVDRQGRLVQRFVGSADEATVVGLIERVAAQ